MWTGPGRTAMSAYMLFCNFTDQGVRTIKDAPKRRAAARELAKKLGVEIKTAYLAIGPYDRTTTLNVFSETEVDKIVGAVA
jgi:uncharacterized protein with GYD domain